MVQPYDGNKLRKVIKIYWVVQFVLVLMLVFMAVSTTYITTPILSRLIRKSEAEAAYLRSHFVLSRRGFAA